MFQRIDQYFCEGIKLTSILILIATFGCSVKEGRQEPIQEYNERPTDSLSSRSMESLLEPLNTEKEKEGESQERLKPMEQYTLSSREYTSSSCEKCNINKLLSVERNIQSLSYQQVRDLLCTIGKICSNNVEFSQFSNELLYSVLSHYVEAFVQILNDDQSLEKDYILQRVASPLLDYDYEAMISLVEGVQGSEETKAQLTKALKEASHF